MCFWPKLGPPPVAASRSFNAAASAIANFALVSQLSLPRLATFCERFSARNILKSPDVFSRYSFSHSCNHCIDNSRSGLRRRMHRWHHKRLARKLHNAHEQGLYRNCKHLLFVVFRANVFFIGQCD